MGLTELATLCRELPALDLEALEVIKLPKENAPFDVVVTDAKDLLVLVAADIPLASLEADADIPLASLEACADTLLASAERSISTLMAGTYAKDQDTAQAMSCAVPNVAFSLSNLCL